LKGEPSAYIEEIPLLVAADFVRKHHYSRVMPKINKIVLGLFDTPSTQLVGVITFGWGVRPQDTIRVLFPSLTAVDYLEIGKLCLLDEMPKNSESRFIAAAMKCVARLRPNLKIIFTWADAIWGKPGYIYQASNFLFGGSVSSEAYRTRAGQRVHPRQLHKYLVSIGEIKPGVRGKYVTPEQVRENPSLGIGNWLPKGHQTSEKPISGVRRPYSADKKRLDVEQVRGLQFRYVYFLCDHKERSRLLEESTVLWHTDYPKTTDCKWSVEGGAEGNKWHSWTPTPNEPVIFTAAFDIERIQCTNAKTKRQRKKSETLTEKQ
jgi:hypothetical protein